MYLVVRTIEASDPEASVEPPEETIDLGVPAEVMTVYMTLANGSFREMRIDGDCAEALEVARGLVKGAGGARPHDPDPEERRRLRLFDKGYDVYRQGEDGYIFIQSESPP